MADSGGPMLSGFRYWNLNEHTTLFTKSPSVVGPFDVFITRDQFATGVWLTDRLRATAGYTFQYVSDVVRPGDQIDRGINPVQAPAITGVPNAPLTGPARPAPLINSTDFWAHGVNFGLE